MNRIAFCLAAALAASSAGCVGIIAAANARQKQQEAEAAQDEALKCYQLYRRAVRFPPGSFDVQVGNKTFTDADDLLDECERLDLQAGRSTARAEHARQVARDIANQQQQANRPPVNCTSSTYGNQTYTNCQ